MLKEVSESRDAIVRAIERFGPAFYRVDGERFRTNLRDFRAAFDRYYHPVQLGYSYKTNYLPYLCQLADQEGALAEVVSGMELEMALRLGISGERIIFNGPGKSRDDLRRAVHCGATIHLDSAQEIEDLAAVQDRCSAPARVGLRANFSLAAHHRSRFGFDARGEALREAAQRIRQLPNCQLAGLHCHFSHFRDAPSYGLRTSRMIELARQLFESDPPEFIDVGGGFCGPMPESLKSQFAQAPPNYADYGAEVGPRMAAAFGAAGGPALILEPGMAVVANAVDFVTEVTATKMIDGKPFAVTAGSIYNVKPTLNKLNLPLEVIPRDGAVARVGSAAQPVDIVGFTCMEIDTLHHDLPLALGQGDVLVFGNVGAYTVVLLPPFIRPAPPVVAVRASGEYVEIRRGQTVEDVWRGCRLEPF